jgi:hypothetical protein
MSHENHKNFTEIPLSNQNDGQILKRDQEIKPQDQKFAPSKSGANSGSGLHPLLA